jgi:heme oxygenase
MQPLPPPPGTRPSAISVRSRSPNAAPVHALRVATAPYHQRVDGLFSQFDVTHEEGFRLFLRAQALAYLPVENALDRAGAGSLISDWCHRERSDDLVSDMALLNIPVPTALEAPSFASAAEVLGGVYVLEGSRLGAALLARSVSPSLPTSFLARRTTGGAWRRLLRLLDESLTDAEDLRLASAAAQTVFKLFEQAARSVLSCQQMTTSGAGLLGSISSQLQSRPGRSSRRSTRGTA